MIPTMEYELDIMPVRLAAKKSREEMAEALGVRPLAVYTWETGRKIPGGNVICDIAKFLGCRPGDLFRIKLP